MSSLEELLKSFDLLLLVAARMSGIFAFAPFWNSKNFPARTKIVLAFFLAFTLMPIMLQKNIAIPDQFLEYGLLLLSEFMFGVIIGYIASIILTAVQFAGHMIDMQMGLSKMTVLDPASNISTPLVGQIKNFIAIIVILITNAHHQFLIAVFRSYDAVPLGKMQIQGDFISYILNLIQETFVLAFCISAPVVGTLFIIDVVLAIITRTIPQLNIFVIGFPIKIMVGFIFLILSIAFYVNMLDGIIPRMLEAVYTSLSYLR
ncbi:MAG: flagellar biosynthetic protein FliR [bacterium]